MVVMGNYQKTKYSAIILGGAINFIPHGEGNNAKRQLCFLHEKNTDLQRSVLHLGQLTVLDFVLLKVMWSHRREIYKNMEKIIIRAQTS